MASALTALANATVTLSVPGTGVVTDPDTGNVRVLEESVTFSCYLKADRMRGFEFPGVEVMQTTFDGYAITTLDARVKVGTTGVVLFGDDEVMKCEVTGLRMPFGTKGVLGSTLTSALGERIQLIARDSG